MKYRRQTFMDAHEPNSS